MIFLKIDGATCQGCVNAIENALGNITGVNTVSFNLDSQWATIDGSADITTLSDAVEVAGFDVVESKQD